MLCSAQSVVTHKSDVIEYHNGKSYFVHTVQKGQTVYSISRVYDVTPDEIYFENPASKNGISINQSLLIPTVNKETELKKEVVKTNFDFFYHVAANNETFEKISSIYLIPENYIVKANPKLTQPFREGEYVKVPVEDAFDILDGKVSASNQIDNSFVAYKPPVSNTRTTIPPPKTTKKKTTTNTTNVSSNKPVTKKPIVRSTKAISSKQITETVSFDPEIPIIADYRHVVILGETTQSIAKKYDIPIELLKAANPGLGNTVAKSDRLRVPDKTKIIAQEEEVTKDIEGNKSEEIIVITDTTKPNPTPIAEPKIESINYKVKKKETLYSIGREYGLTVAELIEANPGLTSSIKIGQIIIVPKKKISEPYIIHKASNKTKTSRLAKLYRISTFQIKDFNPELGSRIYRNQEVRIPVGSHAIITPFLPENDNDLVHGEISDENEVTINPYEIDCEFTPDTNRVIRVALMIPLSLEEADSLNMEQFFISPQPYFKPFRFIKFYEGVLIALDSLAKQGVKAEFYIYDVDKNITKTAKVLQQKELRTMDIIIGPFFNNSFNQVALYAGNFNIPIVNPLSYRSDVVNNYKTVFKLKPSIHSQKELLETYIQKYSQNSKIFLISQTSYIDADIVTNVKNGVLSIMDNQVKISNEELFKLASDVALRDSIYEKTTTPPPFTIEKTEIYPEIIESSIFDSTTINNTLVKINYSVDSLYTFLANASPIRNNLVILYGTKKSFILDVLNKLNESRDTFDIQLVGLPTWERINNLSNVKMNNLNLTYFSSSYIDYELDNNQDFINEFRNRFNSEPDGYAFSGFDIAYYFLNALYYLGDDFNRCIDKFPMELTQGKFSFQRIGNTKNFVNDYWHLLQLKNMTKVKISDYKLQKSIEGIINE